LTETKISVTATAAPTTTATRGGLGEVTDPDVDEAESGNEEVEIA